MNWGDESEISLERFLVEWQRTSTERTYRPMVGDSSTDAADRFIAALVDLGRSIQDGPVVVVTHGGVTVDALRTLVGDASVMNADPDLIHDGVPCCAITHLEVEGQVVSVETYPSTSHLGQTTQHRPA
jgi:broad specificity phosphatase PhoE